MKSRRLSRQPEIMISSDVVDEPWQVGRGLHGRAAFQMFHRHDLSQHALDSPSASSRIQGGLCFCVGIYTPPNLILVLLQMKLVHDLLPSLSPRVFDVSSPMQARTMRRCNCASSGTTKLLQPGARRRDTLQNRWVRQ